MAAFVAFWNQTEVGKTVGGVFADTPNAKIWTHPETGFPPALKKAGFTWIQPPLYTDTFGPRSEFGDQPVPDDSFREQIEMLKDANCEIMTGNMSSKEIARFWDQARALDYRPKIVTIARGLIFPSYIEAVGERAHRMTTEVWWSPSFPYSSSLTGQSAQELADAYTAATARPWTMALGQKHALFEVIADVVKRTEDLDDPSAIVEAIARTKLNTVAGPIEWTGKPVRNVAKTPVVVGQ
jgi:branched-chain amino acid transport system substrate-binding protein